MQKKIEELLKSEGALEVGFCKAGENPFSLPYAISFEIPLSDTIIDQIETAPTHTYFHHYRTVNALL